jgi:Holliday junction resolvase-like predicted endonuclease
MIFIEVKKRRSIECAFEAISFAQRQRLMRAAKTFVAKNRWCGDVRFDVIVVVGWKIHWIKSAI